MIVNTVLLDLPTRVKGFTIKTQDDGYTIVLNARLSHETQIATYDHEVEHIQADDFFKFDAQEIEFDAHHKQ